MDCRYSLGTRNWRAKANSIRQKVPLIRSRQVAKAKYRDPLCSPRIDFVWLTNYRTMRSACRSKTATRCPVMSFAVPYGRATRRQAQTFSIARRKSSCETPKCLDQYFKQLEQNPKQSEQNRLKEARPSIRSPVKCSVVPRKIGRDRQQDTKICHLRRQASWSGRQTWLEHWGI
jgi:hypothetical protein